MLAAEVDSVADLYDPGLRTQCRRAALLTGHLVVLMTHYGDGLDVVRHGRTDIADSFRRVMDEDSARARQCHEFLKDLSGTSESGPAVS